MPYVQGKVDVRNNIRSLAEDYLRGQDGKKLELADFHVELLQLMFEGGYRVVNWPTDHMKSYTADFLFPILSLIDDPNSTHLICGANIADSKSRVFALELELETNERLTEDFPWVAKPEHKDGRIWTATHFNVVGRTVVNRNYSVLAVSTTSKDVRGRRGKLIMDDIEGTEARNSPAEREKLLRWVREEGWRCLEDWKDNPRPLLIALGTPFDSDSIYFNLELQGWARRWFPAYTTEQTTNSMGEPWFKTTYAWPRKAEKVREAREQMTKEQFSIAYLMDPKGGDPNRLSAMEILDLLKEGKFEEGATKTFASLDPASGSTLRRADYAGVAVVRINWKYGEPLPTVNVLEAHKDTQGSIEQVHFCAQLAKEYGDCPVIVETNAMQRTYAELFQHLHPETQVIRHNTTDDKKFHEKYGLTILPTLLRASRLLAPREKLESEGFKALVKEIRDLGQSNTHDHIACSIWFAIRHMYEQARAIPKIVNGYAPGAGRAWAQPYREPYRRMPARSWR